MDPAHKGIAFLSSLLIGLIFIGVIVLAGMYIFPEINWGKLEIAPVQTVVVSGEAKSQETTQIARFTAGVSAVNDNKDQAVKDVNQKMETIIAAVKSFGIPDADIKTQDLSVYQAEQTYYEEGLQKQRPGQWRVQNTITIVLRDTKRTSELANLLTQSGATNVYGPSFGLDDTKSAETGLLEAAIADARQKAEVIAGSSRRSLGKIISITEGQEASSVYRTLEAGGGLGGGGGAPVEPGTQTVYKTVTVTFELK